MNYRLIIDKTKEEEVTACVHARCTLTDQIELLVRQHSGADRITAYLEDEICTLLFSQIECITVLSGKTYAVDTKGDFYLLKFRLYEVEKLLPASFIRINKSSLANTQRLSRFQVSFNGAVDALFQSGYREYVSRRCFSAIRKELSL